MTFLFSVTSITLFSFSQVDQCLCVCARVCVCVCVCVCVRACVCETESLCIDCAVLWVTCVFSSGLSESPQGREGRSCCHGACESSSKHVASQPAGGAVTSDIIGVESKEFVLF